MNAVMPWQERQCQKSRMRDLSNDHYDITMPILEFAANAVGIEKFGVTSAEPFHTLVPFLESYYEEGRDTGFEHPMSELRWNPRAYFPEAKSIIAVAVPYQTKTSQSMQHPSGRTGVVSRYAWGQDYHVVMKAQLEQLSMKLAAILGEPVKALACVDTTPLVDRAIALRAGIGWIGKNGMLITKEYGSYVFLGALLVDKIMEPYSFVISMPFLPIQPIPARSAIARSTSGVVSTHANAFTGSPKSAANFIESCSNCAFITTW